MINDDFAWGKLLVAMGIFLGVAVGVWWLLVGILVITPMGIIGESIFLVFIYCVNPFLGCLAGLRASKYYLE